MNLKIFMISLFIGLQAFGLWGQEQLTLEEAVSTALKNSKEVVLADFDQRIATSQYRESSAIFLPQISASYSAMATNNPLNVFGFKLQHQGVAEADFMPELLNSPGTYRDYSAQAVLQQPLFNWDLIKNRRAAKLQTYIKELQKQRQEEYIAMQTENEFMKLQFSYEVVKTIEETLEAVKSLYKNTKDHYDQGYVQKSDLLNVEVYVKSVETQLQTAEDEIKNFSDNLSILMGKSIGTIYQVDSLKSKLQTENATLPEDRADFEALSKASESYDQLIKGTRGSVLPKLNGFASYQYNDDQFAHFDHGSYLVGLELKWDIFKGNSARSKVKTQKIEQERIQEERWRLMAEGERDLAKAERQLESARYKITQTQTAVDQAQEALKILRNRYEKGLASITDVLLTQQQLSQNQLQLQQAILEQNITLGYINFLTKH